MKRFVLALALLPVPALAAAPVTGRWLTAEKDSIIEIAPCGKALCGRAVRVLKRMPDGRMPVDRNNPNSALRGRPVEGLTVLSNFTDAGGHWAGRIYDPKSGKTYRSKLTRNANGTLKVEGCVAIFCQAFTWTPVR